MRAKKRSQYLKKSILIPGVGRVSIGPDAIPSKKGESSRQKIIRSIEKIRTLKIFPPFEHAAA